MFFLPFAVVLQIIGRLDLSKLIPPVLDPHGYESVISVHGIAMLFIVAIPAFSGLMNYLVPIHIGARDMAFPRLNALSFWLIPPAGLLVAASLFVGGFSTGWTTYPPLADSYEPFGVLLALLGVIIAGISSILNGVNILTTIIRERVPGMNFFKMPVFVWTAAATALLTFSFTQFVFISLLMIILERLMGMNFFQVTAGGDPLLYQYLFWSYSHPATYIFVLPGLGVISEIIPVFTRKPLFSYKWVDLSALGISIGGTIVFGHHMFAAGMPVALRIPFMVSTMLVAVPTGVKIFAWTATMWGGKIRLSTAFLFVVVSIVLFLIGGLTGIIQASVPADLYVHATYWIPAHFHVLFFGGFLLPLMAAIYFWFPKVTGRMLSEGWGKMQWLLMAVGSFLLTIPMFALGLEGMRRRAADYQLAQGYQPLHILTLIASVLLFLGLVIMVINVIISCRRGAPSGKNPWDSRTLEWSIASPPPERNFDELPIITGYPYGYGRTPIYHYETRPDGKKDGG
jgi:cytochrome c oxidase subunit 1